jgi:hypothetical protein
MNIKKHSFYLAMFMIGFFATYLLLSGCGPAIKEEYPTRWVKSLSFLPPMEGFRNAGFFEFGNVMYSHYCDAHGNMVRIKFNDEKKTWEKYKYETFGCIESKGYEI